MARHAVPVFPAMVVAIPLVIGIAAISTNHQTSLMQQRDRVAMALPIELGDDCVLDGREQSFVVVGSSGSYVWPQMLQDMLDEHVGGRVYHVNNASVSSSPVSNWTAEVGTQDYESTFGTMLRDYFGDEARLRSLAPSPSIALCQVTLQGTVSHRGPVSSMVDKDGIRIGADALERLGTMLHEHGVERVYMAMHMYKDGFEPHVGNERLALRALLDREHDFVFEGPDVWSATIAEFPHAFGEDRQHLSERGMKIVAEAWYRTLAGSQASQAIIDRMHARTYDVEKLRRDYLRLREPG